jgi:hypothetical protein
MQIRFSCKSGQMAGQVGPAGASSESKKLISEILGVTFRDKCQGVSLENPQILLSDEY